MIKITDKTSLRKFALEKRATFSCDLSVQISHEILTSSDFKKATNVAIYLPIKNEIDISGLLNVQDKNFYLPRCSENELEFVKYNGMESLKLGKFDILEPVGEKINPEILDVIYIPALIANSSCYRLGYGRGYYDRFFANFNIKARKYIIIAKELILDDFIQEKHDFKCDGIISA